MKISIYTWGTGSAFGRELGLAPTRARRNHPATSIVGVEKEEIKLHILIDAGAPCVETMIDNYITRAPDVLFITHPHTDHVSDFDKLVNSRVRGLLMLGKHLTPLPVVCTEECVDAPIFGLRARFAYLGDLVKWLTIPAYDMWYSISVSDGELLPTHSLTRQDIAFHLDFKALPVYHAFAPGACLFILSLREESKKIVASGDFESIEERIIENPDLKDPDVILLETNTLKATGTNHSNWEQNKKLIVRWVTGRSKTKVLLNHLGGFEDYMQGYYDHFPTDNEWNQEIKSFTPPWNTSIELAGDEGRYPL